MGNLTGNGMVWKVPVDEKPVTLEILEKPTAASPAILVRSGEKVIRIAIRKTLDGAAYAVEINGKPMTARLEEETLQTGSGDPQIEGPTLVTSPMAGKIASVKTDVGATVEEGQALVVLEAMKMENEIVAPKRGKVREIYVQKGALAKSGDRLVLIE